MGCGDHGHFLHDGDAPVDLDDPVDDLDGCASGRGPGHAGEFPGVSPLHAPANAVDARLADLDDDERATITNVITTKAKLRLITG